MNPQQGVNLGTAYGSIEINTSQIDTALQTAQRSFDSALIGIGQRMQSVGQRMSNVGQQLTIATAPLALLGGQGIRAAANFDDALREIQARAGLTDEAMQQVKDTALQLGADTVFSTQQAADAFLQLLTAGLDVEDALATLPQVLDAAAAGGIELGLAADLVTNVMSVFSVEAENAQSVIDAMAAAAASSPADMAQMGEALQRAGGQATMFGLDVEDTSAILAIFAQNGLRGSEAGTQLNSMLRNMSRNVPGVQAAWDELGVTLYDTDGNVRDLDTVFAELGTALENLPIEDQNRLMQTLAGSEGLLGLNALLASDGIDAMVTTMGEQATAAEIARQRTESFKGQVNSLMGSVNAAMITAFLPFMDNVLRPLVGQMIDIVNGIRAWTDENEALTQKIISVLAVVTALGPILIILGQAVTFIGGALVGLGTLMGVLLSPLGLIIAGVVALGVAFATNFMGIRDLVMPIVDSVIGTLNQLFRIFAFRDFVGGGIFAEDGPITDMLFRFRDSVSGAFEGVRILFSWFKEDLENFGLHEAILGIFGQASEGQGAYESTLEGLFSRMGFSRETAVQLTDVIFNLVSAVTTAVGQIRDIFTGLVDAFQGGGLRGVVDFVAGLIANIANTVSNMDWGQVGRNILSALGSALLTVIQWATWINTHLLAPILASANSAIESVDWGQVGESILGALGTAISTLGSWATWVYDNVLMPLVNNARTAIESVDWFAVGENIVNAIGTALQTTFDFVAWIINSIFNPITDDAGTATEGIDWASVGDSIMGAIGNAIVGVFDFIAWLVDTIFAPLLAGAAQAIGQLDWGDIGGGIMEAVANAIPNIVDWVNTHIIQPIRDALANFDPMATLNTARTSFNQLGAIGNAANSGQVSWGDVFRSTGRAIVNAAGFAEGANVIPRDMFAMVHAGEAIIPSDMNPYNPNASQASGGGKGIVFEQGSIVVQANNAAQGAEAGEAFSEVLMLKLREGGYSS